MSGKHAANRADKVDEQRRGFLREAAAAVGGAAAGAVIVGAAPAAAAPGDTMMQGVVNDAGATTTTIQSSSADQPTLDVLGGLRLVPTPVGQLPADPPRGTIAFDDDDRLMIAGDDFAGGTTFGWALSSTWATMTMPIKPMRILDTRWSKSQYGYYVKAGLAGISGGRLLANKQITLSLEMPYHFNFEAFPPLGIQANLTIVNPIGTGYVTVWGDGARPATSSLNFASGYVLSNFVESPVMPYIAQSGTGPLDCGAINIFTTQATSVIIDIVAVVSPLPKPFHAKPAN